MWPFPSKSGTTTTVVSTVVKLSKVTTIALRYDANTTYPQKGVYKQETNYYVQVYDVHSDGQERCINTIAYTENEEEANKVYDFLVSNKGQTSHTEIVKQETFKK